MVRTRSSSPALLGTNDAGSGGGGGGGGRGDGGVLASIPTLPSRPRGSAAAASAKKKRNKNNNEGKNGTADGTAGGAMGIPSSRGRETCTTSAAGAGNGKGSARRSARGSSIDSSGNDSRQPSSPALRVSAKENYLTKQSEAEGSSAKKEAESKSAAPSNGRPAGGRVATAKPPPGPSSAAPRGSSAGRPPRVSSAKSTAGKSAGGIGAKKPPTPRSSVAAGGGRPPTPSRAANNPSTLTTAASATATLAADKSNPTVVGQGNNSQSTSSNKRTFLSGYNLECTSTNVLRLPDPPSPDSAVAASKAESRAKRRRRMSTGSALVGKGRGQRYAEEDKGRDKVEGRAEEASLAASSSVVVRRSGMSGIIASGMTSIKAKATAAAPRGINFDDSNIGGGKGKGKRKVRNSLCHVPSPAESASCFSTAGAKVAASDDMEVSSKKREASFAADEEEENSPKRGIVFDDDGDDDEGDSPTSRTKRQKKRKKRQSVFLPSDLATSAASASTAGGGDANAAKGFYSDLLSYKESVSSNESSSMSICSNSSEVEGKANDVGSITSNINVLSQVEDDDDPSSTHLLLQAVREVCALPEERRCGSDHAKVIELLGNGYPYIPPSEKKSGEEEDDEEAEKDEGKDGNNDLNWTFSPGGGSGEEGAGGEGRKKPANDPPVSPVDPIAAAMEKRRQLILALGPVVERMEAKKKEEVEACQKATGCRVSRTRKGRYKYYDIETDEEVRPKEYKRRYCGMVERLREERTNGQMEGEKAASTKAVEDAVAAEECKPTEASETEVDAAADNDEEDAEDARAHDMSMDDGDDMDISLMPSVKDADDITSRVNGDDSRDPEVNIKTSVEDKVIIPEQQEEKVASPEMQQEWQQQPSSSSADIILPIPDRDNPDPDPQIAAAADRLWADFDDALKAYSRRVLAIRAARTMGFTLSQDY